MIEREQEQPGQDLPWDPRWRWILGDPDRAGIGWKTLLTSAICFTFIGVIGLYFVITGGVGGPVVYVLHCFQAGFLLLAIPYYIASSRLRRRLRAA